MSNSKKLFTSTPDDTLLVRDPNKTLTSRTLNNKTGNTAASNSFTTDSVSVDNIKRTLDSVLSGLEVKDVLLKSEREAILEKLYKGADKDLLNNLKRTLPPQYSELLENSADLLKGKKKLFTTESGERYYGLDQIAELTILFELKDQWDRYVVAKDSEVLEYRDIENESQMTAMIADKYIMLDNPIAVLQMINGITDERVLLATAKSIFLNSVINSQLIITKALVSILTPAFVRFRYPNVLRDIFANYVDRKWPNDEESLQYVLGICLDIDPEFHLNPINKSYYNMDLFRLASRDALRIVSRIPNDVEVIDVYGVEIDRDMIMTLLEVSKEYKDTEHYEEINEGFPYILYT